VLTGGCCNLADATVTCKEIEATFSILIAVVSDSNLISKTAGLPWLFCVVNCSSHNYNLLLHGVGSKQNLMNDFIASELSDVSHVIVNGFFPSLTIKNVSLACSLLFL